MAPTAEIGMLPDVLPGLERLVATHRAALGGAASRVLFAAAALALVVTGFIARTGTLGARVAAGLALAAFTLGCLLLYRRSRARYASEGAIIRNVLLPARPDVGARVLRALALSQRVQSEPGGESPVLARHHYERLVDGFGILPVQQAASVRAKRLRIGFWAIALVVVGVLFVAPMHLFEGLNVLFARKGQAPIDVSWLESPSLRSQPPAYLGLSATEVMMDSTNVLPEGSVVSVRGTPRFSGRRLVLTDGKSEVAFADDGAGAVVAHWAVADSAVLRVAARFGDVLVFESSAVEVHSQEDLPPAVQLADAPRDFDLATLQRLELRWSASDDHALSEVSLVLRSGGREERRPLEHFASDQANGSGGHVLYPTDPFLQRVFLPVSVRVEARDNDSRQGSKWGVSEAFTLRPTVPGAPEALRHAALTQMRDELVRFLGKQILAAKATDAKQTSKQAQRELTLKELKQLEQASMATLDASYAGLDVPKGWVPFARAQFQRVRKAIQTGKKEREALETAVLAIDAALQNLGNRDAGEVAKRLGDVADEAAFGAHLAQQSEADRALGRERVQLAVSVLQSGAGDLQQLGGLGRDLGGVTFGDLGRITRSIETSDYFHAELAALHLAARLHRPTPSFGAKGGSGGVESGPGQSGDSSGDAGEGASDADSEFDRMAQDIEQLAQEHADGLERTASAMNEAERSLDDQAISAEAKRRAESLRRQVLTLPQPGEDPGTSGASAALAREHTGAMAHELERLGLEGALESGSRARSAAEEALRRGDLRAETEQTLRDTLRELEANMSWTEERLRERKAATEQAARQALSEMSKIERELAERARRFSQEESSAQQGKQPGAALPEEVKTRLRSATRFMDEAVRALEAGKGEQAVDLQRQAQRLLEESETGKTEQGQDETRAQEPGAGSPRAGGGDVPAAERRNAAEDFRKRVLDGLGKRSAGPLSGAVKRYAEGLLR
jgi:Domain of unknown function (DUF4175)